jgi:Na+/H+-dicarboxylate symporter
MKRFKFPIIAHVLFAMLMGVLTGLFMPSWFIRIFVTFNAFFGQFIGFLVPLIILALVTAAIANTERNAGKMLTTTLVIVFGSTILSGLFAFDIGDSLLPFFIEQAEQTALEPQSGGVFGPYFSIQLPPALDVMSALVLTLMLGLGIRASHAQGLKKAISELQDVVMLSIERALIPLLPTYIYGIFLHMSAAGEVVGLLKDFVFVLLFVVGVEIAWALLLYILAGISIHQNPFKLMKNMMPACLFAFATSSSAATIPVTLKQTKKFVKDDQTVSFGIPLCANLHIPGLNIHVVLCAIALMLSTGMEINFLTFIAFIIMLAMTCVAAPGIPGGSVAVLPVLATVLNFSPELQAICLSLCIAADAPITAVNVLCDGAVAIMVDKQLNPPSPQE